MDWFRVSHTEAADCSAMKTAVEGDDRHLWYPRHLAHHGAGKFLRSEVDSPSSHFLGIFHEHQLHGVFVATSAAHHGDDVVGPGRSDPHQDVPESVPPVVPREDSQSGPVDEGLHHLVPPGGGQQSRVVVAQGDAGRVVQSQISAREHLVKIYSLPGNVGEDVQEFVTVNIHNIIPNRGFVVDEELYGCH